MENKPHKLNFRLLLPYYLFLSNLNRWICEENHWNWCWMIPHVSMFKIRYMNEWYMLKIADHKVNHAIQGSLAEQQRNPDWMCQKRERDDGWESKQQKTEGFMFIAAKLDGKCDKDSKENEDWPNLISECFVFMLFILLFYMKKYPEYLQDF